MNLTALVTEGRASWCLCSSLLPTSAPQRRGVAGVLTDPQGEGCLLLGLLELCAYLWISCENRSTYVLTVLKRIPTALGKETQGCFRCELASE